MNGFFKRVMVAACLAAVLIGGGAWGQAIDRVNPLRVVVGGTTKAEITSAGALQVDSTITAGTDNTLLTNPTGTIRGAAIEQNSAVVGSLFMWGPDGWEPGNIIGLLLGDGSEGAPTVASETYPDTGWWWGAGPALNASVDGTQTLSLTGALSDFSTWVRGQGYVISYAPAGAADERNLALLQGASGSWGLWLLGDNLLVGERVMGGTRTGYGNNTVVLYTGGTARLTASSTGVAMTAATIATLDTTTIASGAWNGTIISLAKGGTAKNLTAVNGGLVYMDADSMEVSAAGSSGQIPRSGGAGAPTWSASTYPSSASTAGKVMQSDGTNFTVSTPTWPTAAGTAGKVPRSDGTNVAMSATTYPDTTTDNLVLYSPSANVVSQNAGFSFDETTVTVPALNVTNGADFNGAVTIDGQASRSVTMDRQATSNTAGNPLTFTAGGATSGATDKNGGALVLSPGPSTGTGRGYVQLMGYKVASATGTSDNTQIEKAIFGVGKTVTDGTATAVFTFAISDITAVALTVPYSVEVVDGTNVQAEAGVVAIVVRRTGSTTYASNVSKLGTPAATTSSGTLSVTFDVNATGGFAVVRVNADTSLTASTGFPRVKCSFENLSENVLVSVAN